MLSLPILQEHTQFMVLTQKDSRDVQLRKVSEDQTMYADIFFACGNAFLFTLIQPLGHTITTFIEKTDIKNLRSTIRQHLGIYGQKQIRITSLHSDNEKGITAMALDFSGLGISLLQVGAGMHVPQIERRIRYIKELSRSIVNGLPYTCPRKIFQYLVIFVTSRANMFPSATAPHGDSPFRLMEGRTPTDKDTNMEFGALYQVSSRTMDNSMDSRTIAAIGIAQVPNGTETCRFMTLLKPYAVITANHFVHVPMNQDVIDLLNEMASQDSRPISKDIIFRYHGSDLEGPLQSDDIKDSETSTKRNHPTYNIKPVDTNIKMPIMLEEEEANHPDVHTSPELPLHPVDFRGGPFGPDDIENQVPELLDNDSDDESDDESAEEAEVQDPEYGHYNNETPPTPPLVTSTDADDKTSAIQGDIHTPPISIPYSRPSRIRKAPDRLNLISQTDIIHTLLHATARKAMKDCPEIAGPAIILELTNLTRKKVIRRRKIIPSQMNITLKVDPTSDGTASKSTLRSRRTLSGP